MSQIYKKSLPQAYSGRDFFFYLYPVPLVLKSIKIGVFIACANFLIQGISFLVQNYIARNLGTSGYGFFGVLQTDYSIFCTIADFGMSTLVLAFFDWYFICGKFWKKLFISKLLHSISYSLVMGVTLLYFKVSQIELVALAMVLAALPAFTFGVTQALSRKLLRVTRRTFLFFKLMFKASAPYAISSFATCAYLPVGLYVADKFASAEFLSSYNFGHKILILCSGIMVHFISSNLVAQHMSNDKFVHVKEIAVFTAFVAVCSSPLWLFPRQFLQILFFAVHWTPESLDCSASILKILSFSLLFQAARLSMISTLLKNKATWTYAIIVSSAGAVNVVACTLAGSFLANSYIPLFALTGDLVITVILLCYYLRRGTLRW